MKSARLPGAAACLLLWTLAGCGESRQAMGNVNSIIVVAADSLWESLSDSMLVAMEPRIFTVRNERSFELTHVSPTDPRWGDLRRFRQVLAVGRAEDQWVEPVLRQARRRETTAPSLVQTADVWARNQLVTALVVPAENSVEAALSQLPRLAVMSDSLFRVRAQARMFTSRADTLLRDTLLATAGFGLILPNVYHSLRRSQEVNLFQNSTDIGGDLVRSVLVASRPGLLEPTAELALTWRDSVAAHEYRPPHDSEHDRVMSQPLQYTGRPGIEVQGVWEARDTAWPLGGPFITRIIQCPEQNRTYLLDSWLYAPSRPKYEYMIQLQTILNTFACAPATIASATSR